MTEAVASGEERTHLQPGKTVVLCLDTLGDLTLRQPLFRGLMDAGFPVTVVVRKGYEAIVPFLDGRLQVLVTEINPYHPRTPPSSDSLDELHRRIADLDPAVLVSALFDRTDVDDGVLRRFQGQRVGLVNPGLPDTAANAPRGHLLDQPVRCRAESHEAEKNNALLEAITGRAAEPYSPVLSVPEKTQAQAAEILKDLGLQPRQYVLGSPAGSAQTPLKAWPADDYAALVEHLARTHRLPVLVTGVAGEAPHIAAVAEASRARGTPVQTWIGDAGTLGVLLGLIRSSRLYLGADTGPMHFAGALDVPVVARFGGGHWPRFLPLARRSFVGTQELPCFGCEWDCWLDDPLCVRHGSARTFQDAVDWILSGDAPERRVDTGEAIVGAAAATLRAARAAKQRAVDELTDKVVAADDYRKWLEDQFARLDEYRKRVEADGMERLAIIEKVAGDLAASEADRAARGQVIEAQARLLRPFPVRALLKVLGWLRVV